MGYAVYIGIEPCGCRVAACVDTPECAEDVAEMVRNGYTVERQELKDGETVSIASCIHEKPEVKQNPLFAEAA